jgi:hypothetical protein
MWDPRRLTALWASTACCRDSCTFYDDLQHALVLPVTKRKENVVLWDVTPCIAVEAHRNFRDTLWFHLLTQLAPCFLLRAWFVLPSWRLRPVGSSEVLSLNFYRTTQRHVPEYCTVHTRLCGKLTPCSVINLTTEQFFLQQIKIKEKAVLQWSLPPLTAPNIYTLDKMFIGRTKISRSVSLVAVVMLHFSSLSDWSTKFWCLLWA